MGKLTIYRKDYDANKGIAVVEDFNRLVCGLNAILPVKKFKGFYELEWKECEDSFDYSAKRIGGFLRKELPFRVEVVERREDGNYVLQAYVWNLREVEKDLPSEISEVFETIDFSLIRRFSCDDVLERIEEFASLERLFSV